MFIGLALWSAALINASGPFTRPSVEAGGHPGEAAAVAHRVGLNPVVLVVSGVTHHQATQLLSRIEQATALHSQFASAKEQVHLWTERVGQLRNQLRNEPANAQLHGQLRQAEQGLTAAKEALTAAQELIAHAAANGLGASVVQRMGVTRRARNHTVPAEFLCVDRTPAQWRQLKGDLVVERRAQRRQQAVPNAVASRLAAARAHESVVAARQALTTQLPFIQSVFGPS